MNVDHETALRFASSLSDDTKASDIQAALREYLRWLATCGVCAGDGKITYGREYKFATRLGVKSEFDVKKPGDTGPCPKCVGTETWFVKSHIPV